MFIFGDYLNKFLSMKIVCIIIAVSMLFISCTSSSNLSKSRQLLKEYAYCKCFQFASGDTAYFINDVSLSIYSDMANYNFNAYNKIDSLSRVAVAGFRPSEIADYKNKKAVFWNCFKFYKSKQLDSAVKKLDEQISRSW
jgi:hypothetical protein